MGFIKQKKPVVIPVPDNKLILEHFGLGSTGHKHFSVARMEAPGGWREPYQNPEFDELILMMRGKIEVEVEGEVLTVRKGESLLVEKDSRVQYSNPFDDEAEYWSVCLPAFSPEKVNREEPS